MKLIGIEHNRCGDHDSTEFYLVPDDWDDDKISSVIEEAVNQHISNAKALAALMPVPERLELKSLPEGLTVAEAKKALADDEVARTKYYAERNRLSSHLDYVLRKLGVVRPHEDDSIPRFGAYWGHNHGLDIKY